MHDLEPLMTYADVAALAGLHPRSLRREVLAGRLKPIILGERTVRFEPAEVRAWLERAKTETAKALGAIHDVWCRPQQAGERGPLWVYVPTAT